MFPLTSRCRVILERLTFAQPVKKFLAFYEYWRFITVFTTAHHVSFICARWIHSTSSQCYRVKIHLIWSSTPRLGL